VSAFPEHLQSLLHPQAYAHAVSAVQLIETHISWVLLTGEFAYKIKRPVEYDFVDQRSSQRREFLCHEELRLNRRFAPELYLSVSPITRRDGQACVGGSGTIIEHCVVMRQFPSDDALDRLLARGQILPAELESFGHELARIHARLPAAAPNQAWGGPANLRTQVLRNAAACARAAAGLTAGAAMRTLQPALATMLDSLHACLARRFASGRVRECHGDLHAGNVVRRAGRLLAFDCLEFDPALRWIDVADEVAFLVADLEAHDRSQCAHAFLTGYCTESGDYEGCALLRLFKIHRALVRAKVTALSAAGGDPPPLVDRYVQYALRVLEAPAPVLILMCGVSGSGKSWLAARAAPRLLALHLRSDVERKRVAREIGAEGDGVAQGRYAPATRARVYRRLRRCTWHVLAGGYATIADATFADRTERARFRRLAARLGVPVCLVYCRAAPDVLQARVRERRAHRDDPSEADLRVLEWQQSHFEPVLAEEALPLVEIRTDAPDAVERLLRFIETWRAAAFQYKG
jgi:hypothetical protein